MSKKEFGKNVGVLAGGTMLAQVIPILISPLLTRLFNPEEFGSYAIYISLVAITAVVITLRYELAIVLPKDEEDAEKLKLLCYVSIFSFFILLLAGAIFFGKYLSGIFRIEDREMLIYLFPFSVLFLSCYNVVLCWRTRNKEFRKVGGNRVFQSGLNSILSLSFGWLGVTSVGLVIANFISGFFSFLKLNGGGAILKKNLVNRDSIVDTAVKYREFPKKTLPSSLLNVGYNQGKLLLIGTLFASSTAGLFALTFRVIQTPINVVSSAIADVLFQDIANLVNLNEYYQIKKRIFRLLLVLILLGFAPALILYFYGQTIFKYIFGEEWQSAGQYASIMSLGFFSMFVGTPFCKIFYSLKRNGTYLIWEIVRAVILLLLIGFVYVNNMGGVHVAWAISLGLFLSYLLLVVMMLSIVGKLGEES